nr:pre-peptidase C-terminal domain-containing protein [uncultured Methanoregula sp.]
MRVSGICLAILICAIVLVSGVSAKDVDSKKGYSVTPAGNLILPAIMSPMSVGTITQGETDWYSFYVSQGTASLTMDLNWGYAPDSLTLTVLAPDSTLGPFYDSSDGTTNGRITLIASQQGGLTPGTWKFKVYGENVLGTQSYNFVTY